MKSLFEKFHSPQVITKIPEVLNVANTYVKTDLSFYEMSQYASMLRSIDRNKIEIATLPGAPNQKGYISYWILDPVKTQEVINRIENIDVLINCLICCFLINFNNRCHL